MITWQDALFTPRRVAVVGASASPGKAGALFLRNLTAVESGYGGEVVWIDSLSRRSGLAKAAAGKQKPCQPISLGNKLIRSSPKLPIPVKLFKLTRRHLRLER
jgi:hypothetical protein